MPSIVLNTAISNVVKMDAAAGVNLSPSRASRLARRSLRARARQTETDVLQAGLLPLTYEDPTGETAVWNVLTGGGDNVA